MQCIMTENDAERDHIWGKLYDEIVDLLGQHGKESPKGDGDFWVLDDNYGWRRHTVYLFSLTMLDLDIIERLRRMLDNRPDWEIVLAIDVPGREKDWPPMGLTLRNHEIIDGLSRAHLPEPYRSLVIPGSKPGTGYD
jgi:hypothetical protein